MIRNTWKLILSCAKEIHALGVFTLIKESPMTTDKNRFSHNDYERSMELERRGLISCLSYILQEVELAGLDLAALHLKIAIEEIRDAPRTTSTGPVAE